MATFVIPYHVNGKTRLGDRALAQAMLADVRDAAGEALVVDAPGGQGAAVAAALAGLDGPVTIVNSDLPCVTAAELDELTAAAPALVAAPDGTTTGQRPEPLGDKLARSDGVLCPPSGVDPEMHAPAPDTGKTPVIPPPGSPGGDPTIRPK